MKYIDREKLNEVINELLAELNPSDFADQEEYRLSQDLQALPIGVSLWAYVFLTPDGEVISTGYEPGELERSRESQDVLNTLAWGAERYPLLEALIPERPQDSKVCPLCDGLGGYGNWMLSKRPAICVCCSGLGWVINDA